MSYSHYHEAFFPPKITSHLKLNQWNEVPFTIIRRESEHDVIISSKNKSETCEYHIDDIKMASGKTQTDCKLHIFPKQPQFKTKIIFKENKKRFSFFGSKEFSCSLECKCDCDTNEKQNYSGKSNESFSQPNTQSDSCCGLDQKDHQMNDLNFYDFIDFHLIHDDNFKGVLTIINKMNQFIELDFSDSTFFNLVSLHNVVLMSTDTQKKFDITLNKKDYDSGSNDNFYVTLNVCRESFSKTVYYRNIIKSRDIGNYMLEPQGKLSMITKNREDVDSIKKALQVEINFRDDKGTVLITNPYSSCIFIEECIISSGNIEPTIKGKVVISPNERRVLGLKTKDITSTLEQSQTLYLKVNNDIIGSHRIPYSFPVRYSSQKSTQLTSTNNTSHVESSLPQQTTKHIEGVLLSNMKGSCSVENLTRIVIAIIWMVVNNKNDCIWGEFINSSNDGPFDNRYLNPYNFVVKMSDTSLHVTQVPSHCNEITLLLPSTSIFLPPEYLLSGELHQSYDVYCIGLIMYFMLSSYSFETKLSFDLDNEIIQGLFFNPMHLQGYNDELVQIIATCCNYDKNQRCNISHLQNELIKTIPMQTIPSDASQIYQID
ncbi:hypothetical protein QTN25_001748 [Entamoeba marina]